MKKSFYSTLGVKDSASAEEIKRAYRRKAAESHPDKGGAADEMAELNRAYACLKDPQSRLTYDQTGEEPKLTNTDQVAGQLLMFKFMDALKQQVETNVLSFVKNALTREFSELSQQKKQLETGIAKLRKRRDDITVKKDLNLWQILVDQEIKNLSAGLQKIETETAIRKRALEILVNYSEIEKEVMTQITFTTGQTGTWTIGGNPFQR